MTKNVVSSSPVEGDRAERVGQAGFSLIELILVVAVIGIISTISIGAYMQWLPRIKLRGTAEETAVLMQRARLHAIRTNQQVRVLLDPSSDPTTGQWLVAMPEGSAASDPSIGLVTLPTSSEPGARISVTWTFPAGELVYSAQGTIASVGAFRFADQKSPANILEVALDDLAGTQPRIRKFLLAGDAPGGAQGFYTPTVGSDSGKNVWVWY